MAVKRGYKQTAEHVRKRFANNKTSWKGDGAVVKTGRTRALRMYGELPVTCERCGKIRKLDRHHKDGNTLNNIRSNVEFICRRCHMESDGRLGRLVTLDKSKGISAAAAVKRSQATCKHGHPLSGGNLYLHGGKRHCRACARLHGQEYRKRKAETKNAGI